MATAQTEYFVLFRFLRLLLLIPRPTIFSRTHYFIVIIEAFLYVFVYVVVLSGFVHTNKMRRNKKEITEKSASKKLAAMPIKVERKRH